MDVKSNYKELHRYEGTGQILLMDEVSGELCLKKYLEHYEKDVYEYLRSHTDPHIPRILEYGTDEGGFFVIEQYFKGTTLDRYLARGAVTPAEKRRILFEVMDGLTFLHSATPPIIHRDLKPENIIIDNAGVVRLIDFDAAKFYKPGKSRDTELIGTQGMAAPEQYGFAQSDARTDIYALGLLIRELFPSSSAGSSGYSHVVSKATKIDPEQRYSSVIEMRKELKTCSSVSIKKAAVIAAIVVGIFVLIAASGFLTDLLGDKTGKSSNEGAGFDINVEISLSDGTGISGETGVTETGESTGDPTKAPSAVTPTPVQSAEPTQTTTPTVAPTEAPTSVPTETPAPAPTAAPVVITVVVTATPTPEPLPEPTATPAPTMGPVEITAVVTATSTPVPSPEPTATPTPTTAPAPTATPIPVIEPTVTDLFMPSATPTPTVPPSVTVGFVTVEHGYDQEVYEGVYNPLSVLQAEETDGGVRVLVTPNYMGSDSFYIVLTDNGDGTYNIHYDGTTFGWSFVRAGIPDQDVMVEDFIYFDDYTLTAAQIDWFRQTYHLKIG